MWTMPRSIREQWNDGYDGKAAKKMIQLMSNRCYESESGTLRPLQGESSFSCMAIPCLARCQDACILSLRRHKSNDRSNKIDFSLSNQLKLTIIACQLNNRYSTSQTLPSIKSPRVQAFFIARPSSSSSANLPLSSNMRASVYRTYPDYKET